MGLKAIRAVANAILYEGYMLYPYRPSALKNRSQGWTFGTLVPADYAAAQPGETAAFSAQVLVTGHDPRVTAEVRFLQLCGANAIERTVCASDIAIASFSEQMFQLPFHIPASANGPSPCLPLQGVMELSAARLRSGATRVTISVRNQSQAAVKWDTRDHALQQALVSAHALMTVSGGEFISLLNPPEEFTEDVRDCTHSGVFPVLTGEEGEREAMLISPIILYDYPQVAAGSHGDFFDSSEIDEMLTLRVLTLTDAEKEEVRASSERARAVLERTESLAAEDILKLHGVLHTQSPATE